jgi:hypothetical protein
MTIKQMMGLIIVLSPFMGLFILGTFTIGFIPVFLTFLSVFALTVLLFLGFKLLE